MKKLIIILLVCFSAFILAEPVEAALSCQVRSGGCLSGETAVFKMSNTTNAHAELSSQTNYNYYVCCSGVTDLGNSCSGNYATVLRLSSITNAHVEKNNYSPQNYFNYACLSVPSGPDISCIYETGSCSDGYAGLASISGETNAHVGDYNNYSIKVCCTVAEECIRANPEISLSPSQHYGEPGESKEYIVEITNNDTALCGESSFNLNSSCPNNDWNCSLSENSKIISPGSTDSSVILTVTSYAFATAGDYNVSVTAANSAGSSYSETGSATYIVLDPEVFDFSISASPSSDSIVAGNDINTYINLEWLSGDTQLVALSASDLPPGASVGFYSNGTYSDSCSPGCSRRMNIFIPSDTNPDNYSIKITGTGGGKSHDVYYNLTILTPEEFNFSIRTEPTSGSTNQGGSVLATVITELISGTTESVTFSVISGLPELASVFFSPSSCSPSCNSTMTINISASTPIGTYSINVCGTGGEVTQCVTYSLTVTEAGEAIDPPQVTTDGADNITQTSATLNGTLNNMGNADSVLVWFEWGPTTAMGNTTAVQTMNSVGAFSADISGLTSNTPYYFQAFAQSGGSW